MQSGIFVCILDENNNWTTALSHLLYSLFADLTERSNHIKIHKIQNKYTDTEQMIALRHLHFYQLLSTLNRELPMTFCAKRTAVFFSDTVLLSADATECIRVVVSGQ